MADPDVARTTVVSCCRYLTAPYLRVPLLLSLFADATRVRALGSPELRDVLDACLFEPGPWQPRDAWDAEGGLATDGGFGAGGGGGATTTVRDERRRVCTTTTTTQRPRRSPTCRGRGEGCAALARNGGGGSPPQRGRRRPADGATPHHACARPAARLPLCALRAPRCPGPHEERRHASRSAVVNKNGAAARDEFSSLAPAGCRSR